MLLCKTCDADVCWQVQKIHRVQMFTIHNMFMVLVSRKPNVLHLKRQMCFQNPPLCQEQEQGHWSTQHAGERMLQTRYIALNV